MSLTQESIRDTLSGVIDPNTGKDFIASKSAKNIQIDGGKVSLDIELGYPAKTQIDSIKQLIDAALRALPGVTETHVNVSVKVVAHAVQRGEVDEQRKKHHRSRERKGRGREVHHRGEPGTGTGCRGRAGGATGC